ncbi:ATP-binding protein [Thiohalomonas denitrificans]|uniref:Histidine kinase-, DNA gyrase B-, and HSP90-like ATPase n=1 Tax=Thiohalomonas denitrificans TaxID=415747 RepID=A0A1G5QSK6_9GAMM|nr:ATP-binding protein [Thiohalomonas denitrificans]SCZ64747.1 Histidine kinase-, DNA gyrase B-, and HSP90-like ATPase [Thiohalomonas denitrificans]
MVSEVEVVDTVRLKPDAGLVKSLGSHHTFESAIADLVDNCIDAEATRISVRMLTKDERLVQVEVVDNGKGMDAAAADQAMTLGHQRKYGDTDLGYFGVGLKAASFGQSEVLTVWSSRYGAVPVGRRIKRANFSKDFSCQILSSEAAAAVQIQRKKQIDFAWGTTVVWSGLRSTYHGRNIAEAREWLSKTELAVRQHLGVTFHRLIAKKAIVIDILVDEFEYADEAIGTPVKAIDPFGYATSGRPGYPKTIVATSGSHEIRFKCHIWPAKTDIPGYRIQGKSGEKFQGFYIYRNDRLLQVGGWSAAANSSTQRRLARVIIDDASVIGSLLTMNPEKSGLRFEAGFKDALAHAQARDGTTFDQYLLDAEDTYKTANKRTIKRHPVIAPDRGFAPAVRKQIGAELGLINSDALEIRWVRMGEGDFFDIDFGNSTLLLNQRYRHLFAPQGSSLNDAPLIKALMFLLTHQIFEGTNLGPKDKDNIALWRAILGAAVEAEEEIRYE